MDTDANVKMISLTLHTDVIARLEMLAAAVDLPKATAVDHLLRWYLPRDADEAAQAGAAQRRARAAFKRDQDRRGSSPSLAAGREPVAKGPAPPRSAPEPP